MHMHCPACTFAFEWNVKEVLWVERVWMGGCCFRGGDVYKRSASVCRTRVDLELEAVCARGSYRVRNAYTLSYYSAMIRYLNVK